MCCHFDYSEATHYLCIHIVGQSMKHITFFLLSLLLLQPAYGYDEKNSRKEKDKASEETEKQTSEVQSLFYTTNIREHVVMDHGKRCIRIDADERISYPEYRKDQTKRFIVMSKKDFYLYVYEGQDKDTILLARYDCAFSQRKGNKQQDGDMKTPHCTLSDPFTITEIKDASTWTHDFKDGRGAIKSYGKYFLRLQTNPHHGIGIHGSTNNEGSVPGRSSEGCIRLLDEDIIDLRQNYAFVGMKVVIKEENQDDLPFETRVFERQGIRRKRHLDPSLTLSNEEIEKAVIEQVIGKIP